MSMLGGCSTTSVHEISVKQKSNKKIVKSKKIKKTTIVKSSNKEHSLDVSDLKFFPQYTQAYEDNIQAHNKYLQVQKHYSDKYFEPWKYRKPPYTKQGVLWPFSSYTYEKSYGENLQAIPKSWFDDMFKLANFKEYGSLNKKAISLNYLNVRNFPTSKPVFKDPSQAGEGFPFDYMQNSGIYANEPLFVSHLSENGQWAYIFTSYVTGWVKLKDIAFLNNKVITSFKNAQLITITDEFYPIKDLEGNFVFNSRVGMRLPLISIKKDYYIVLAITQNKNHTPSYTKVKIPFYIGSKNKLKLNKNNFKHIIDLMLQSKYGWGGLYEQRDCSSMLRDLYAPFDIWLPRNSSQQSKIGRVISLEGLSLEAKKEKIISKAIPFETLLYKKGHILLYLGVYKGKITVLHDMWGIRTLENEKEGRRILGKTVISSLSLGKEQKNYNEESGLLEKILSMNIITELSQDIQ